jgi:hypothetical protein
MSAWKDYVTTALLGAGKTPPPALPEALAPMRDAAAGLEDEAKFLTQAGALALWRRAGWKPAQDDSAVNVAEIETTRAIGRASVGHLRAMLSGRHANVLPEWLDEAARRGWHVAPEYLPGLLDRARQDRSLRPRVLAAGGRRAAWLAAQNAAWAFGSVEAPELWETGTRDQRVAILRSVRASAPAEARARLEAVWASEPADTRSLFLTELLNQLSNEDAPFLETVLDDRSREVRKVAMEALARLPNSPFVERMIARVTPLLRFSKGGLLSRASFEVNLPPESDPEATRDGLDSKAFGQQKKLGDRAVLLVLMLAAVPLRHWTESFQQTPVALLKAAEKNEFAQALATGWAWAAVRQRDAAWAQALLDAPVEPLTEFLPSPSLLALLPEAARADRLAAMLRGGALNTNDFPSWQKVADLLATFSGYLPASVARELVATLRRRGADGLMSYQQSVAETFLLQVPPAMLPEACGGWSTEKDSGRELAELLIFRRDALSALNPS